MSITSLLARAQALLARDAAGAEPLLREAVTLQPHDARAHALLGHVLRRLGRHVEARGQLGHALTLEPRQAQAWRDLALAALADRDYLAADEAALQAVELLPADPMMHLLRGHVLGLCGRYSEADEHFAKAAIADPTGAARIDLAFDAITHRQPLTAHYHASVAVRTLPQSVRAWKALGEACIALERMNPAAGAFRTAIDLAPDDLALRQRAAKVFERAKVELDLLVRLRTEALALEPRSAQALAALSRALVIAQRWDDLHEVLKRLLAVEPQNLLARWMSFLLPPSSTYPDLASIQAFREQWCEGLAWFEALDHHSTEVARQLPALLNSVSNFYLAYCGSADVELHKRYAAVIRRMVQAVSTQPEAIPRAIGQQPRRIGVLSSHLHSGVVARAWNEALLSIPGGGLELHVFYTGTHNDQQIARMRDGAQSFHAGPHDFSGWCATLRDANLDVLIFVAVGMDAAVQALASLRHAPVQAATWGHPVTTGMPSIDYFLSSDLAEADDADTHYSERLVRLPQLGGCFPIPAEPVPTPARPAGGRFLCMQSLAKLTPVHDALFARILQACPEATLTLLTHASRNEEMEALRRRLVPALGEHGVSATRLRLLPMLGSTEYLAELVSCDVVLDTLDFSGGLTSLDALWHEKPVVTLPGKLMRGRQTLAMLRRLELAELVARDTDDYVRIAGKLVESPARHAEITTRIAARKNRLFDDRSVCDALRSFLLSVQPPAHDRA